VIASWGAGYHSFGKFVACGGGGGSHSFSLVFLVELHEFGQVELRLLQHLCLVDEDVLEREDFGALIGDGLGD